MKNHVFTLSAGKYEAHAKLLLNARLSDFIAIITKLFQMSFLDIDCSGFKERQKRKMYAI